MPFYEYQCKNCGHELEAMQRVSDSPLKKCPHCGKSQLQRLMSAPVFRLKGGGWYETDFKGDGDNKRNLADKPEADAPKDKDSKSSDAKPDEKSDVKTESASGESAKTKEKKEEKTADRASASAKTAQKKVNIKSAKKNAKKPALKRNRRLR
jgi:putative FmdB family regulatory protein